MRRDGSSRSRRFGLGLLCASGFLAGSTVAHAQCLRVEDQELRASDARTGDEFGLALDMDGDVLVVGAPKCDDQGVDAGAAYVFRDNGSTWVEQQKILAPDGADEDEFGSCISVSGDAVLVGAPLDTGLLDFSGSAYLYRFNGATWVLEQKLTPLVEVRYDQFGTAVVLDGTVAAVSTLADTAYVFRFDGTTWVEEALLAGPAGEEFGTSLALEGNRLMVGAPRHRTQEGVVYEYLEQGGSWTLASRIRRAQPDQSDFFGHGATLQGNDLLVGAYNSDNNAGLPTGTAWHFRFDGSVWSEVQSLEPFDGVAWDAYGWSVAMDGTLAVVGAQRAGTTDTGASYAYRLNQGWVLHAKTDSSHPAGGDFQGTSVALTNGQVVAGAPYHNDGLRDSGTAYVHRLTDLALMSNRSAINPDKVLTLTTCGGLPGGAALLAAVEVNGAPTFAILAMSLFDGQGQWLVSNRVPAVLSGLVIDFQTLGVYLPGAILGSSNRVTVTIN